MKKIVSILALCIFVFSYGCQANVSNDESFATPYALDAHQYCLLTNKQITPVVNQITSIMVVCEKYVNEKTDKEACVSVAAQGNSIVSSCRETFKTVMPPSQYEDSFERVMVSMKKTEEIFEGIKEECELEKPDKSVVSQYITDLEVQYALLTSEFNTYYE